MHDAHGMDTETLAYFAPLQCLFFSSSHYLEKLRECAYLLYDYEASVFRIFSFTQAPNCFIQVFATSIYCGFFC